jgi:hypothetical protein
MKIKTYQIALVLLLSVLVPVVLTASVKTKIPVAEVCKGNHPSRKDFYKSVRMLPPSSVLEIVGNRLNYAIVDEGIELGSVELEDGYSIVPKEFSREHHSGCYGITMCEVHKVVLLIDVLPQGQCKTVNQ